MFSACNTFPAFRNWAFSIVTGVLAMVLRSLAESLWHVQTWRKAFTTARPHKLLAVGFLQEMKKTWAVTVASFQLQRVPSTQKALLRTTPQPGLLYILRRLQHQCFGQLMQHRTASAQQLLRPLAQKVLLSISLLLKCCDRPAAPHSRLLSPQQRLVPVAKRRSQQSSQVAQHQLPPSPRYCLVRHRQGVLPAGKPTTQALC